MEISRESRFVGNGMRIEYDQRKNEINLWKHKISIHELAPIFDEPNGIIVFLDKSHSIYKDLYYLGWTTHGNYVLVWYNIVKLIQSV